jgi:hypothetical protein
VYKCRQLIKRMDNMKVKIDDLAFDRTNYDGEGKVVYFTRVRALG